MIFSIVPIEYYLCTKFHVYMTSLSKVIEGGWIHPPGYLKSPAGSYRVKFTRENLILFYLEYKCNITFNWYYLYSTDDGLFSEKLLLILFYWEIKIKINIYILKQNLFISNHKFDYNILQLLTLFKKSHLTKGFLLKWLRWNLGRIWGRRLYINLTLLLSTNSLPFTFLLQRLNKVN